MKAILLAAGRGTRIARSVEKVPKSTLPVDGVPLIKRTVDILKKRDMEIVVCTGYEESKIRQVLSEYDDIKYYFNPFYERTNSIASLWFAKEALSEDTLIINADVFFSEEILDAMLMDGRDPIMAIDYSRKEEGDYFFYTSLDGRIEKYGKGLPIEQRNCEYVGMARISQKFMPMFVQRMDEMIYNRQYDNWWENILYSYADEKEYAIYTVDVDGKFWAEIDYFDDYERIIDYIAKEKENS